GWTSGGLLVFGVLITLFCLGSKNLLKVFEPSPVDLKTSLFGYSPGVQHLAKILNTSPGIVHALAILITLVVGLLFYILRHQ
ncbi:MAG: hypothetical protein K8F91_18300, partial [Candidatus Obscuribacterales bacterium]|nr:hypothetical protein [Candidatus Obscuribacterales bacterium]